MSDQEAGQCLAHWRGSVGAPMKWKALHEKRTVFLVHTEAGAQFVLKFIGGTSTLPRLASEHDVIAHLTRCGVPVSVPLGTDDGRPFALVQDRVFTLSPALLNDQDLEGPDRRDLCANIGRELARLHRALEAYPRPIDSWHYDLPSRIFQEAVPRILQHLTEPEQADLNSIAGALQSEMICALSGLPEQHIHGDSHRGNILLHGGRVSGFIDLDHLPHGPRVYDLGYLMADMLKNSLDQPDTCAQCLNSLGALIGGYETESMLSVRERAALWFVMLAVQLMFSQVYFVHNDSPMGRRNLTAFYSMCRQRERIYRGLRPGPGNANVSASPGDD